MDRNFTDKEIENSGGVIWRRERDINVPLLNLAEREGFEPSMDFFGPYSLSRGAPSTSSAISPEI